MTILAPYRLFRRLTLLASLGLISALGACASPGFEAEVTRFHTLPAPAGETLLIEPLDNLEAGIEFGAYANLIGERLGALGYIPAKGADGGEPSPIAPSKSILINV